MKKRGFTLAEVLIALALIGIVASMTIPTFVSSSRNQANASKLSTIVSAVENAFTSMIAIDAVQTLRETTFGTTPNLENFSEFIKLAGSANALNTYYESNTPFITINRVASNIDVTEIFQTKNGALLIFEDDPITRNNVAALGGTVSGSMGKLAIDVNGATGPNMWGRDVFYFRIGDDGILHPAGSINFSILENNNEEDTWSNNNSDYACTDATKTFGCTARLIENNYEIDY